jgi:hypothetical protein
MLLIHSLFRKKQKQKYLIKILFKNYTFESFKIISRTISRFGGDGKLNHSSNFIYKYLY